MRNSRDHSTLIAAVSLSLFSNEDQRKCCYLRNKLLRVTTLRNPFVCSPEDLAVVAARDKWHLQKNREKGVPTTALEQIYSKELNNQSDRVNFVMSY